MFSLTFGSGKYLHTHSIPIEQLQLRHENTWQSTSVWQKKYCAQWQLKGSRCLTHDLCATFIGFTQRDNCAIAIVNIIKAEVPSCSRFWVNCTTDHSFATQTRKITEITRNKQRDVQLIYGRDVTCNCSIAVLHSLECNNVILYVSSTHNQFHSEEEEQQSDLTVQ